MESINKPTTPGFAGSQPCPAVPDEVTSHLQQQVAIVSDLFSLHESTLSKPEQEWIQNAINYTQQLLSRCSARNDAPNSDGKPRPSAQSYQALPSRNRQAQTDAMLLNSQILVAVQILNNAMSMLSWCGRSQSLPALSASSTTNEESMSLPENPPAELSHFLNKRRAARHSLDNHGAQLPTAGARTADTADPTVTDLSNADAGKYIDGQPQRRNITKEPLTLADTVENWRQEAENAFHAATRQSFEPAHNLHELADTSVEKDPRAGSMFIRTEPWTSIPGSTSHWRNPTALPPGSAPTSSENLFLQSTFSPPVAVPSGSQGYIPYKPPMPRSPPPSIPSLPSPWLSPSKPSLSTPSVHNRPPRAPPPPPPPPLQSPPYPVTSFLQPTYNSILSAPPKTQFNLSTTLLPPSPPQTAPPVHNHNIAQNPEALVSAISLVSNPPQPQHEPQQQQPYLHPHAPPQHQHQYQPQHIQPQNNNSTPSLPRPDDHKYLDLQSQPAQGRQQRIPQPHPQQQQQQQRYPSPAPNNQATSFSDNRRKSKGRAWLERQAAMDC